VFACSTLDERHKLVYSILLSLYFVVLELKEFDVGGIQGGSNDGQGIAVVLLLFLYIWEKVID